MKNEKFIENVVKTLNEALEADPEAMRELCFEKRVVCNKKLAEHPTIQAGMYNPDTEELVTEKGLYMVGLLGILNGFAINEGYVIYVVAEENQGSLHEFKYEEVKDYFNQKMNKFGELDIGEHDESL